MANTFNVLGSDLFTTAANPLNPAKWTADYHFNGTSSVSPTLRVVDLGDGPQATIVNLANGSGAESFTGVDWTQFPNQWASFKINRLVSDGDVTAAALFVRQQPGNSAANYSLWITNNGNGTWNIGIFLQANDGASFISLAAPNVVANFGDVFKISAVGNVITSYQNNVVVSQVTDSTLPTGKVAMWLDVGTDFPDVGVTNFQAGNIVPGAFSVTDSRSFGNFPNSSRNVQGTLTYDVPSVFSLRYWFDTAFARTQPLPVDSRAAGATQDSRVSSIIPLNSRVS